MLIAACDPQRYAGLGVSGWHASCQENLQQAMADTGVPDLIVPRPVNLFMNVPLADGELGWEPARSRPGDAATLRAVIDCLVAVSACPQDIVPINGSGPAPMLLEVLGAARGPSPLG